VTGRLGARLFLRTLRPNWLGLTPPPANRLTVTRPTPDTVQIEVSGCYRLDAFGQVGTPEVAFIACFFEGFVMDVSPFIRVTWNSMATGAEALPRPLRTAPPRQPAADHVRGVPARTGFPLGTSHRASSRPVRIRHRPVERVSVDRWPPEYPLKGRLALVLRFARAEGGDREGSAVCGRGRRSQRATG
jgi:hypothetical protein